MKLCKYYSLDECHSKKSVFEMLDNLQDDSKIEYSYLKEDDVIKINNDWMNDKQKKSLLDFFDNNDVIDYPDYDDYIGLDGLDDDEEDEDYDNEDED